MMLLGSILFLIRFLLETHTAPKMIARILFFCTNTFCRFQCNWYIAIYYVDATCFTNKKSIFNIGCPHVITIFSEYYIIMRRIYFHFIITNKNVKDKNKQRGIYKFVSILANFVSFFRLKIPK